MSKSEPARRADPSGAPSAADAQRLRAQILDLVREYHAAAWPAR